MHVNNKVSFSRVRQNQDYFQFSIKVSILLNCSKNDWYQYLRSIFSQISWEEKFYLFSKLSFPTNNRSTLQSQMEMSGSTDDVLNHFHLDEK